MKTIQLTSVLLLILSKMIIAQTGQGNCIIKYIYDASGNRVQRGEMCGGSGNKMSNPNEIINEDETTKSTTQQQTNSELDIAMLFPNPTSSSCFIILNKPVSNATLELYDTQGKIMHYERVDGYRFQLDLSTYASGTYIIIVKTQDKGTHRTVIRN